VQRVDGTRLSAGSGEHDDGWIARRADLLPAICCVGPRRCDVQDQYIDIAETQQPVHLCTVVHDDDAEVVPTEGVGDGVMSRKGVPDEQDVCRRVHDWEGVVIPARSSAREMRECRR